MYEIAVDTLKSNFNFFGDGRSSSSFEDEDESCNDLELGSAS